MTTDFTPAEIAVRERIYAASQEHAPLWLTSEDVALLSSTILKTGREICILRAEVEGGPLFTLSVDESLADYLASK